MGNAHNRVERPARGRVPRVLVVCHAAQAIAGRLGLRDRHDIHPRRHDLANHRLAEFEHAADQPALVFTEVSARRPLDEGHDGVLGGRAVAL